MESEYICKPTNQFEDMKIIEKWLSIYRKSGGKIPMNIEIAIQGMKTGNNLETAMNSACNEMARFLVSNQEYCANFAGFDSHSQMKKEQGERWQDVDQYDICMLQKHYKTHQVERVKNVLYLRNPKSFASVFSNESLKQLWSIINRYLKKKLVPKKKTPSYENPGIKKLN